MTENKKIAGVNVVEAQYEGGFKLSITYSDGKCNVIDFHPFMQRHRNGYLKKYHSPAVFKKFYIENGNLVWGENWDMVFPVQQLHNGRVHL